MNSNLSFLEIRKNNIDNLEREYNTLIPKCLDYYKKWKYLSVNKSTEAENANNLYIDCKTKLTNIQDQLNNLNSITSEEIIESSKEINKLDKTIFENQNKINNDSNILKEKHVTFETDNIKVIEYTQLNNSISIKNILLILLVLIITIILSFLIFSYFIKV